MSFFAQRAFLGVLASVMALSQAANASDLMIWSPVKVAPQTYKTTLGFRLPMAWEMSAGVDLGLGGTTGGTILRSSELATLWGRAVDDRSRFATVSRREVALRVDALNGSGMLYLGRSRNWIVSDNLDMRTSRSLNVNYVGARNGPTSIIATQAVAIAVPWTGTSISASGNLMDGDSVFSSTVVFQQPLASNLNFSASFTNPLTMAPTGDVRFDYRIKW